MHTHKHAHTQTHLCDHPLTFLQPLSLFAPSPLRNLIDEQIEMFFCISECLADQLATSLLDEHVSTSLNH